MTGNKDNKDSNCFIITPIGSTESGIRRATEGLIEAVIIPTLKEAGFQDGNISVAHRISESGSINRQIIKRIVEDDLAIVNLTGLNPNVMYELAVRHATGKPLVMLAEKGTNLPFDIVDQRTIFYTNDMLGAVQLKEDLYNFILQIMNQENIDNPLIQFIQENNILSNVQTIDKSSAELILERLDRIERKSSKEGQNKNSKNIIKFSVVYKDNLIEDANIVSKISNLIYSNPFLKVIYFDISEDDISITINSSTTSARKLNDFTLYIEEKLEELSIGVEHVGFSSN